MTIDQYIQLKRMTYLAAAEELGVDYTTLYRWINAETMPRPAMLKKIKEWSNGAVTANDFIT
jgi:predicted DNA-binding transcriptional regulator AlpA